MGRALIDWMNLPSILSTYDNDEVKNQIAGALVKRIIRAAQAGEKIQVIVTIPGFSGNIMDEGSLKIIMAAQYRTINRGGHSIYAEIRKAGFEPLDFIRFYHLRSYDRINAPLCKSPPSFHHEAQIALARQWIGNDSDGSQKEVTISLPVETKEGITVPIPESEDAARRVIEKFEAAAKAVRGDEDVADNVAQHMLHDRTSLLEEKWLGSEQEELDAYVSELLYIHMKLMIVDDKRVVSEGDGDSEIALVVEDGDIIRSTMNGKPYEVARFATTSSSATSHKRTEEASSFMQPAPTPNEDEAGCEEDGLVADPLPEQMVELWNKTARKNREIFTEIFRPVPTNLVRDWEAYDGYVPKVKAGHVVPGIPLERVKKQLSEVMGALVECPLDFLIDQKEFVEGPEWKGLNPTLPVRIYNAKESAQVLWLFKVYRKQDESNVHLEAGAATFSWTFAIMSFRVKASERKTTPSCLRTLARICPNAIESSPLDVRDPLSSEGGWLAMKLPDCQICRLKSAEPPEQPNKDAISGTPDQPPDSLLQGKDTVAGQLSTSSTQFSRSALTSEKFNVRAADVDFDEGGEYAGLTLDTPGGSSYSRRSEVKFQNVPPHPLSEKPPAPHVLDELRLMRTRPTYEYISVFVANMSGSKTHLKGLRGLVVGWHESAARAKRHARLRKRGKEPKDDQAGMLLTIRPTASTSMASIAAVPDPTPFRNRWVRHILTRDPVVYLLYSGTS
ncbi:hypothetical protein B0H14DRAFT_3647361 [Mycena olivaceomarginata]|nr:hypothetical protein B0H14DRAFT_3647361 [Mycena olivaceomarginata]